MGNNSNSKEGKKPKKVKLSKPPSRLRFGICYQERSDQEDEWLLFLRNSCREYQSTYCWADKILTSLKKFEGYPIAMYQKEVNTAVEKSNKSSNLKLGLQGTKKKKKEFLNPQEKYKRLLKKSDILEEEIGGSFCETNSLLRPNPNGAKLKSNLSTFSINNKSFSSFSSDQSYAFPQFSLQRQERSNIPQEQIDELEIYVSKTDIISKHLKDTNHVLGFTLQVFFDSFISAYQNTPQNLFEQREERLGKRRLSSVMEATLHPHNINDECIKEDMQDRLSTEELSVKNKLLEDVKEFIRVLSESILLFYGLENREGSLIYGQQQGLFSEDNMNNFVTSQVFKNNKIYSIIKQLLQLEDASIERKLKAAMQKLHSKKPQFYYISDQFTLNELTLQYYKKDLQIPEEGTDSEQLYASSRDSNEASKYKSKNVEEAQEEEEKDTSFEEPSKFYENASLTKDTPINKSIKENDTFNESPKRVSQENQQLNKKSIEINNKSPQQTQQHSALTKKNIDHYFQSSFENQNELTSENENGSTSKNKNRLQNNFSRITEEFQDLKSSHSETEGERQSNNSSQFKQSDVEMSQQSATLSKSEIEISTSSQKSQEKQNREQKEAEANFLEPDQLYFEKLKRESYYPCMKCLLKLKQEQSPIGKMKMIIKTSENIESCINTFYKKHGIPIKTCINADDALSLFRFLSVKCMLYDINADIQLISEFLSRNLLSSISGYYLTTLAASLQNILEISEGKIEHLLQSMNLQK